MSGKRSAGRSPTIEVEATQHRNANSVMKEIEKVFQSNSAGAPDVDIVGRLTEHCDASLARRNGRAPTGKQERLACGLSRYLHDVEALGVVSGVLIGWLHEEQPGGYLWTVLSEEYRPGRGSRPEFQELNRLGSQLEDDLSGVIWLYIAHVSPSNLDELRRRCEAQRIETRLLDFQALPQPR